MRKHFKKRSDEAEVNMTPMLDIVFILLIFFIVTATFLREKGLDLRQPPPNENTPQRNVPTILVEVDQDNNVFVNKRQTDVLRVTAAVERLRADKPGAAVILIPDDTSRHGITISIVDGLRSLSIPVNVKRKDEP